MSDIITSNESPLRKCNIVSANSDVIAEKKVKFNNFTLIRYRKKKKTVRDLIILVNKKIYNENNNNLRKYILHQQARSTLSSEIYSKIFLDLLYFTRSNIDEYINNSLTN